QSDIIIETNVIDSDGLVKMVELLIDGNVIDELTSGPWTFVWKDVPEGDYSLRARATDDMDATATSAILNVRVRNNQHPTVTITSPSNGSIFNMKSIINISAKPEDIDGFVTKVEFYGGTKKLGEVSSSPWKYSWVNPPGGAHSLTAIVTDNLNAKTTSTPIEIQVVNEKPQVEITSPEEGNIFISPASIDIKVNATDNDGDISKIEFYSGESKLGEKNKEPWSFYWEDVPSGNYTLTAIATDNLNGSTRSIPVSISVNENSKPKVSLTNPIEGSVFTSPISIAIKVKAEDEDGNISKIEFFSGEIKLGEVFSEPWSFNWENVASGNYAIFAVATDNFDAVSASKTVNFSVNPEFKIYPNPTTGIFNLELSDSLPGRENQINIYSISGKLVYQGILLPEELLKQINLSYLDSGFYILILAGEEMTLTRKFIKN
ncbi:MAG: T9SS type A sorting domain-containing protein, partial [Bacteroidales bacterium]|nr:T9SS type A sorting domain-containing protein [Bacteroidales bacterium]